MCSWGKWKMQILTFFQQEFAFSISPNYTWQKMVAQHSHCLQIFA